MLSLKIVLTSGLTKTMRFTGNMSMSEACKDIREKTEEGGPDHALFRPPNALKARKGQWLRADRTFNFYDVLSGEELHYRKRHRQMKIFLMDGQEKLVLVDEAAPVRDVCAEICEKLRLEKPYEEWSLTLGSTRSFLDPVLGLQEQGVTETDKVWLKKKHFWTDDKIDKSSPLNVSLMYHQARFGITHGEHFVTEDEAVSFAAVQLQQENGRFDPAKHKPAAVFKEIDHFFEEKYQKKKKMHTSALEEWKNLGNMTELDAMYQYVKLARGLQTYGVVMFAVGVVPPGKREKVPEMLGVAKTEVLRMDYKTRAIIERWPYRMIKRWAATNDMFTLDFGDRRETYYNCYTKNANGIGGQIQGYLDIMMRLRSNAGGVTEINDAQAATIEDVKTDFGQAFEYNTTMILIGDSDGEDVDGGEVVQSDDEDPTPRELPLPLLRPGQLGAGVGDDMLGKDGDPEAKPLPKPLVRPAKNKVFVSDLPTCIDAVDQMQTLLEIPLNPSKVTAVDPDKPRKAFQEGMARLPRDLDDPTENAQSIAQTLAGIIRAAREVAAKDNDISLLEAARRVAKETEEILKCSRDLDDDPEAIPLKKRLLLHKSALKGASTYAQGAVDGLLVDEASEQLLLASSKQLAESVNRMAAAANLAALIASGRQLAAEDDDNVNLLSAAKGVSDAVEDLLTTSREAERIKQIAVKAVSLAKVLPVKVQEMSCVSSSQAEIADLAKKAQQAGQRIMEACEAAQVPPEEMRKVERAVQQVNASSAQLMDAASSSKLRAVQDREDLADALRKVGEDAEQILESNNTKEALDEHSSKLAADLAKLIAAGKHLAKQDDETISLLTAAKQVTSAVEELLSTTRNTADDPSIANTRAMLKAAQTVTSALAEHQQEATLPYAIARREARQVAAVMSELTGLARDVLPDVNASRRKELYSVTQEAESAAHHMVKAVAAAEAKSADVVTQEKLVKALKTDTALMQKFIGVARSCVPAIEKTAVKTELGTSVTKAAENVRDLVTALQAIPDEGAKAFVAVEKSLEKEAVKIDSAMLNAAVGNLVQAVPRAQAVEQLQTALVNFQRGMDVMRKAETTNLVPTGRALVQAFAEVADASVAVASATSDASEKQTVLQKARLMIPQVAELLQAAKSEVRGVAQEDDQSFLDAARSVSRVLRSLVGTETAEAIRAANRKFLPDVSALLKAAKAAANGDDEDANLSLLAAAQTVSGSLKDLMKTMRPEDLPPGFVSDVRALLKSVEVQVGEKGSREGDATASASAAVRGAATELLEVAQHFEEGPELCTTAAQDVQQTLRRLEAAPRKPSKASVNEILTCAEAVVAAANRCADVTAKVPKIARSKPAELAPFVEPLAPAMEELVAAANRVIAVHSDAQQAADAGACVREIAQAMSDLAAASRTAKCDPQANLTMTTALSDLRQQVRTLTSLMEHATPGMDLFEESLQVAAEAARGGMTLPAADEPLVGLAGVEQASETLGKALAAVVATSSEDAGKLGPVARDAADAAAAVVRATQHYDNLTRAVALVRLGEEQAAKMHSAGSIEESTELAQAINKEANAIVAIMKELSVSERSPAIKEAIRDAYQAIKTAQPRLIETAKAARSKEGTQSAAASAAETLVEALRGMVFASPDAPKAEQLLDGGRAVASATKATLQTTISVAKRPGDGFVQGQLIMAVQDVDAARTAVVNTARSMAPGRAELEDARKLIAKQVGEMETAGIAAEIGLLNVATAKTRTHAQDSLLEAAEQMKRSIAAMLEAAKLKDIREMGLRAAPVAASVGETASTARELAGTTGDDVFQVASLLSAKHTGDAALSFLDAAIELSIDPTSKAAQKALLAANSAADEHVSSLKQALKTSEEALARCDEAAGYINEEAARLASAAGNAPDAGMSYAEAQASVIGAARALGKAVQKVQRGAKGNAPEIGVFCLDLSACMVPFVDAVLGASHAVGDADLADRLIKEALQTCKTNVRLCQVARSNAADPNEKHLSELSLAFKACTDALGATVRGIRDAAVGEKECRDAAVAISKAQADLDSAVIFAETGHLQFGEGVALAQASADFEKGARAMLAKTKQLVAASDKQAELGEAAKGLASSVEALADRAKAVASCIGDFVEFPVQKSLLLDTKSAAMRAQAVVVAARNAADPEQLLQLQKAVSNELGALVKSVQQATSAAIETQSALAQARESIQASIDGYPALRGPAGVEAVTVASAVSAVTQVAANVVTAVGKSSAKELLAALEKCQSVVADCLLQCKGAEKLSKDASVQRKLGSAGTDFARCIVDLLDTVNRRRKDNWEDSEAIVAFSDTITDRAGAVVAALQLLPGAKSLQMEESTLGAEVLDTLGVAMKVIKTEAAKLQQTGAGSSKSDIGSILSTAATALLTSMLGMLKASKAVQEELVARGHTNARLDVYRKDPKWAQGLMATADETVAAASFLVTCTNRCANVEPQQLASAVDDLSKAAKLLSGASSKLVAASKAKSDSRMGSSAALSSAGQAVNDATKALIAAAKKSAEMASQKSMMAEKEPYNFESRMKNGELKAQMEIARLERELERAKAAAKAKSEVADGFQSTTRGAAAIDKQLQQSKQQRSAQQESSQTKLRKEAAAARAAAQKKLKKVDDDALPALPAPPSDDEDGGDLAPPPRPDSDDE